MSSISGEFSGSHTTNWNISEMLGPGLSIAYLLNLLELMDSEDTPCIFSVRTSLLSETRRVSSEPKISRVSSHEQKAYFMGNLLVSMFSSANMAEIGCSEVAIKYLSSASPPEIFIVSYVLCPLPRSYLV